MLRSIALLSVLCALAVQTYSAPTTDEIRAKFLATFANQPGYGYLKRIAIDAKRKAAVQRKKAAVPLAPEVEKRVQELEKNGAPKANLSHSILENNKALAPFLFQGDILLPEREAIRLNFTTSLKQNRAGGFAELGGGRKLETPKWPHDTPICYKFKAGSDAFTMENARQAFKFWTENSCLTWQENCASTPQIAIYTDGTGCFTTLGRGFTSVSIQQTKRSDGTIVEEKLIPKFDEEQGMSLAAPGCAWFGTAAHEASHVMGMSHEQSRTDRDSYIDVVWASITDDWKDQYNKREGSQTYGIAYDYGSNMQYTGYANDPKIDMAAKEKIYQHTMGNKYGPIFNDLKFINTYNDCMCKDGISCANGGFPHPRSCSSKCICPEGFGGATCTEREQGQGQAPKGCGGEVTATSSWQTVQVNVPAPKGDGPYNLNEASKVAIRQSCCTWHIKGNGKKLDIQLDSVTPGSPNECSNDCLFGGTEIKFGDLTRGGARVCCPQHAKEFGSVSSTQDMAVVRVCSMRNTQAAVIKFKTK